MKQASENRKITSAIAWSTNYSGFLSDVIVTTRDVAKEMWRRKTEEKEHVFALKFSFYSFR